MPYDSEGNFTRVHSWEEDRVNDIDIVSDRHDEEDDNFADGLNLALLRDGRVPLSGSLNMNNFQVKNVADGTTSTDAINKRQFDTALHKTGDEVSSGTKQFNGSIIANSAEVVLQTEAAYQNSIIYTPEIVFKSNTGKSTLSRIGSRQLSKNSGETYVASYNPETNTNKGESIVLGYSDETGVYARAITPNEASNGRDIATTEWINTFMKSKAAPNYSASVSVGSGYVTPSSGFLIVRAFGNNRTSWVKVGNQQIFESSWYANYGSGDNAGYQVGKGSTISFEGVSCTFYPLGI